MSLSDQDRKSYEAYLLATTDEERQEAIKKLIPGSNLYYHLYFTDKIKNVRSKLSEDDQQLLTQFKKKYPHDQLYKEIETKLKLLEYDDAETDEQRAKVIGDLASSSYLNLYFDHQKPEDLNRGAGAIDSMSSQAEDLDEEEDEEDDDEDKRSRSNSGSDYGQQMQQQEQYQEQDYGSERSYPNEQINVDEQQEYISQGSIPIPRKKDIQKKKGKASEFDYEYYFNKDKIIKIFKGKKNDQHNSAKKLNSLPGGFEHIIDFTTYNHKAVYQWACKRGTSKLADLQNESLYTSLKISFEQIYNEDKHFLVDQNLLDSLTLIQLDKLSQLHPKIKEDKNYIGSYFQKMFYEELSQENQEVWSNDEKRANLLQLYNYAKGKEMPVSLRSSLLIEILELGVKLNIYDEVLFKEYLQIPLSTDRNIFKKKLEARGDSHWNRYINNVQSQDQRNGNWNQSQNTLISQYLEYFCHQKGSLESFKDEFDSKYLKKIEEKISIYNSDDMTNLNVDLKKYQEISQEVILKFLESNQDQFKVDEEVKLSLELKNIQTLYVKIFEFNTETYYKKTLQPFNTGVNLDGLIASIEKNFEYKNPSNKKFIESFSFPELTGKVGLFIVEFIGNGMSSRAIIKKGSLSLIHKPTIAGHLAYVLDENKQICSGPKTGIFFEGSYYQADQEKGGKIFIPYGKSQLTQKAILLNNDFAQLSDFQRLTEDYSFTAWIYVNQESILIGNKAQVLIKPSLLINQRQASVEILKNTKITLTTMNYIDSIPVTKNYENVKFKNNQELVLDFQVPPYLSSISITITTELFNVTKQVKETFSESKNFEIQNHQYENQMNELYLRKEQGNYYLYFLGKNGEPKSNIKIALRMGHIQLKEFAESRTIYLTTDKEGKVKLGPLKKILGLSASVDHFNIEHNYFISQESQTLSYPHYVDVVENETLEFPILFNNKKRKNISLIKKSSANEKGGGTVLEDLFDKIELVKQEGKSYNLIKISGLADGKYSLNIKKVEDGKENDQSQVKIKLDDYSKDSRVHVFAYHSSYSKTVFPFAQWKNIFMSNRELSDEFRYVFDRKYAERFQGNTLERPRLVLKRTFIQATQINQEVLRQGAQYEQVQLKEQTFLMQNVAPKSYALKKEKRDRAKPVVYQQQVQNIQPISQLKSDFYDMDQDSDRYSDDGDYMNVDEDKMIARMEQDTSQESFQISGYQNFLKNAPLLQLNLKPSDNGEINFDVNLTSFNQLLVIAIDKNSVALKQIDLSVSPTQKRDLTLNQPLESTKGFTESRTTATIYKHDTHFIEDITSTEIQLIDDLKKVKGVLDELMKTHSTQNYGAFKDLSGIVLSWFKYDKEEKNKQYNKNFCHELNIFVYFKDREFFDAIVKPFLSCKMEKTFIDHYLLANYNQLLSYASLERLESLNAIEKCFLIDALTKTGSHELAKSLANYIKLVKERDEKFDVQQFNKVFDTVLNLNMLKTSVDGDAKDISLNPTDQANPLLSGPLLFSSSAPRIASRSSNIQHNAIHQRERQDRAYNRNASYDDEDDDANSYGLEMEREEIKRPMMKRKAMDKKKKSGKKEYDEDDDVFEQRQKQKKNVRLQFSEVQSTNEYMETHYHKQTSFLSPGLIAINSFWADYAAHLADNSENQKPFLSSNFVKNANNSVSSLLTFALLDLPYDSESHCYKTNDSRGVEIKAISNIILFKKEVREAQIEITNDILVTHRYVDVNYGQDQSGMPEEFLVNKAYSCEVIMTNVSPKKKEFSMLYQIPQGALPLQTTKYMKSYPQSLEAYTTNKMIFYFYFPKDGDFTHFPSNASDESKIIARAETHILKIVNTLSINKKETFKDIVQAGVKEDILEFLKNYNLLDYEKGFSYNYLLWMLKDKSFYDSVVQILRSRFIYEYSVWQYAFYHKDDEKTVKEYLMRENPYQLTLYLNSGFSSKLIGQATTDNKHLDYFPMINARAHNVGDVEQWTLNSNVKSTYEKFLKDSIHEKELSVQQKMIFIYNLQLQDRITDAIQIFKTIDLQSAYQDSTLQIQYDYMNAYFDFFTGQNESFKIARAIVRKYEDYPISSWRILFLEILDQLNEYDGDTDEPIEIDAENMTDEQRKLKYKQSIKKEPRLECEVSSEKQTMTIEVANIKGISIKFYIIDAEILFSRTPFVKENTEEFSYVKPTSVIERELNNADLNSSIDTVTYLQTTQKFEIDIPENLKNQNMVIEVTGEGKQLFRTYYSTQIKVNILESYGELKVTDNQGVALPKVYVKVFAQKIGGSTASPFFFKDGYTDIRGKFEYAQTSGNRLKEVQKFAIFVMSDTLGSIIKECNPPKVDLGNQGNDVDSYLNQKKEQRIFSKIAQSKSKVAIRK